MHWFLTWALSLTLLCVAEPERIGHGAGALRAARAYPASQAQVGQPQRGLPEAQPQPRQRHQGVWRMCRGVEHDCRHLAGHWGRCSGTRGGAGGVCNGQHSSGSCCLQNVQATLVTLGSAYPGDNCDLYGHVPLSGRRAASMACWIIVLDSFAFKNTLYRANL